MADAIELSLKTQKAWSFLVFFSLSVFSVPPKCRHRWEDGFWPWLRPLKERRSSVAVAVSLARTALASQGWAAWFQQVLGCREILMFWVLFWWRKRGTVKFSSLGGGGGGAVGPLIGEFWAKRDWGDKTMSTVRKLRRDFQFMIMPPNCFLLQIIVTPLKLTLLLPFGQKYNFKTYF